MIVYLGIGTNMGNRNRNLRKAMQLLNSQRKLRVEKISLIYQTAPIGGPPGQKDYFNGAIKIQTSLSAQDLHQILIQIEQQLGRKRRVRWGPRTLDLDILFYGSKKIASKKLKIPHPRLHERIFVLKPLADIAPAFVHPVFHRRIKTLLNQLTVDGQRDTIRVAWKK